MILVTGATGQLGTLVIEGLLKKLPGAQVVAGVRDLEKGAPLARLGAQLRLVDYDRPETLTPALAGIEKVLLVSSNAPGKRFTQHEQVILAAQRAGVKEVAYTSILKADTSTLALAAEHKATEELLQSSGLSWVFLRNGWYTENYAGSASAALQYGAMFGAAGEGRFAPAARADYAAAAVAVLSGEGHAGQRYELAGDQSLSLSDLAAEVALLSGKPVKYQNLPEAEYAAALASFGLPEVLAKLLADADVGLSRGDLDDQSHTLSRLIGRPTTPVTTTLRSILQAAAAT